MLTKCEISIMMVKEVQEILRESQKNPCKDLREYFENVLKLFVKFQ